MAIESLAGSGSGAMESSLVPKFSETRVSEDSLLPKFSELQLEPIQSSMMPEFEYYIEKFKVDENGHIKTINENLKDQNHPVTDVPFKEKTVVTDKGEELIGVFPEFESVYDVQLPEDLYLESDKKQFNECNRQLKEAVESDPELAKKFDEEQLDQIKNGETPDGYTWHHNEETGKMQLVDSEIHAKTGHLGGRTIWGGGSENR